MLTVNNAPQQLDFELPAIIQNDQLHSEADKAQVQTTACDSLRAARLFIKASQVEEIINDLLHFKALLITHLASRITQSEQERVSFEGPFGTSTFYAYWTRSSSHCGNPLFRSHSRRNAYSVHLWAFLDGRRGILQGTKNTTLSFEDNTDQPPLDVCSVTYPL